MRLDPGTTFAKDYQVVSQLSQGGMGTIYVVNQISTGRQRALKLMLPEFVHNQALRQRFEQEARVASRIESDHVVQVIAAGIDEPSGCPWLAMELLKGRTLEARVEKGGLLSPIEIGNTVTQLCHGLRAAHAVSVVHRDLKPENIFLAELAREGGGHLVKILDFGIARISAEHKATKTAAMGTPLWMAPEQSKAGSEIGPRTDIWALGLVVFWMMTGKEYWMCASSPDVTPLMLMNEVLMQPLAPATERAMQLGGRPVPPTFDHWFSCCVNRDIQRRFPDVDTALRELTPVLNQMQAHEAAHGVAHSPSVDSLLRPSHDPQSAYVQRDSMGGQAPNPQSAYQPIVSSYTPQPPPGAPNVYGTHASAGMPPGTPPGMPPGLPSGTPPGLPHGTPSGMPSSPPPGMSGGGSHTLIGAPLNFQGGPGGPPMVAADPRMSQPSYPGDPRVSGGGYVPGPYGTAPPIAASGPRPAGGSKTPIIIGAVALGVAVLAGGGFALSKVLGKKTPATASEACKDDLDVCEKACKDARDKDEKNADAICDAYTKLVSEKGDTARKQSVLQDNCDAKSGSACDRLGAMYALGGDGKRDVKKAASLFQKGCDAGNDEACAHLGSAMEAGWVEGGIAKALPLYDKACGKGSAKACVFWSEAIASGRGTKPDVAKADGLRKKAKGDLDKACKDGDPEACGLAGLVAEHGGDIASARQSYRSACGDGDGLACNNLARLDAEGLGGAADGAGALKKFNELCTAGDAVACNNVGVLESGWTAQTRYEARGEAVYRFRCAEGMASGCASFGEAKKVSAGAGDPAKAITPLTTACNAGSSTACLNLGGLLFVGQGGSKERQRALGLFEKACTLGDPAGCTEAGRLYALNFLEQSVDYQKASELFQKGCDGGDLDGCANIAGLKATGRGVALALASAITELQMLCEVKKVPSACVLWGSALLDDATAKSNSDARGAQASRSKAKDKLTDVCNASGMGCVILVENFFDGPENRAAAIDVLQKGCDKGSFDACAKLSGALVPDPSSASAENKKKANGLVEKACKKGHPASCRMLGLALIEGWTKESDASAKSEGAALEKEACDDGDMKACANYGGCFLNGDGVAKSTADAKTYLKKACDAKLQYACDDLKSL